MTIPIQFSDPPDSNRSFNIFTQIHPQEIKFLLHSRYGKCFWTNDKEALRNEQCKKNISQLCSLLEIPPKSKFTSAFIKSLNFSCDLRWNFGSIALFYDIEKIKKETIVFNGDVKNVAFKLFGQNASPKKYLRFHSLETHSFHILVHLQRYYWNYMAYAMFKKPFFPRMIGSYFEARILRPITAKDIKVIVIPDNLNNTEKDYVERLANSI